MLAYGAWQKQTLNLRRSTTIILSRQTLYKHGYLASAKEEAVISSTSGQRLHLGGRYGTGKPRPEYEK
jgi:hypothetical protein